MVYFDLISFLMALYFHSFKKVMLRSVISFACCSSTILISCQEKGSVKNLSSVEKEQPNSDYKPAFNGQTRVAGYKTQTEYQVDIINTSLGRPWGIAQLPSGDFLITEKTGFINLVSKDGKTITKITGLPKVDSRGQGGLLDIAIDPDFLTNKTVYWTFSEPYEKGNLTAVGKGVLFENKIDNVKIIFQATPSHNGRLHYGSRLIFDKSENLFVSTGERSDLETRPLAQDLKAYLGKILKIDKTENQQPEIHSLEIIKRNRKSFLTDTEIPRASPSIRKREIFGKPKWDPEAVTKLILSRPGKTTVGQRLLMVSNILGTPSIMV